MAEYIEREALLAHIKDLPTWWADDGGYFGGAQKLPDGLFDPIDIISSIENALAVDAVEVVRCRDCEYSYDDISGLCCSHGVYVDCEVSPDFYCAEGKRKETET